LRLTGVFGRGVGHWCAVCFGPALLDSRPVDSRRHDHPADDLAAATPEEQAAAIDQTVDWPIRRYRRSGQHADLNDKVVREQRIELVLNGNLLLAMLALPRDVEALALGFLLSEGLWRDRDRLPEVEFDASAGQVRCAGRFDEDAVESLSLIHISEPTRPY